MANKITLVRGTSRQFKYKHVDSDGVAVPLVGKKLYFTVKSEEHDDDASDSTAIITKTIASGNHEDAAAGLSEFTLTDEDTFKPVGTYHYDVIIEDETTKLAEPPSLFGELVIKGTPSNRQVGN